MTKCIVCNSKNILSIYYGPLRTGCFGKSSKEKYHVFNCKNCNCKFLKNILSDDYYESPEYRENYNNTIAIQKFYKEYDFNDTNKISKIGLNTFRDLVVADFGTAAGSFLQLINKVCKYTIAIEPTKYFHSSLLKTNKYVFSYGKDLLESGIKIDIATSFDVIEHVDSPIEYLKEIYESLNINGKLYLKTPNFNDILQELTPKEFEPFNYRTAHLFYFCKESIEYILKESGFKNYKLNYIHDYDISNLLYWMKECKPTGLNKTELFDEEFNLMYKKYLERIGKASHIWIEATK